MPHKPKPNPCSETTNLYSNPDGLMHNQVAENQIQATIGKSLGKTVDLAVGCNYDLIYKTNGQRKYVRNFYSHGRKGRDGKLLGLFDEDGNYNPIQEIHEAGDTGSGLLARGRKAARWDEENLR